MKSDDTVVLQVVTNHLPITTGDKLVKVSACHLGYKITAVSALYYGRSSADHASFVGQIATSDGMVHQDGSNSALLSLHQYVVAVVALLYHHEPAASALQVLVPSVLVL